MKAERESVIERHLADRVRGLGGVAIKLLPTIAGVPDRMVMLPGGRLHFVELKTRTGRVRLIQRVWHERFEALGWPVAILRSTAEVDDWLERRGSEADALERVSAERDRLAATVERVRELSMQVAHDPDVEGMTLRDMGAIDHALAALAALEGPGAGDSGSGDPS